MHDSSKRPDRDDGHGLEIEVLIEEHRLRIRGFISSLVFRSDDVDDILQETCLTIWNKRAEFEPGTRFLAWAFRIARFKALSWSRDRQRSPEVRFDDELLEQLSAEAEELLEPLPSREEAVEECFGEISHENQRLISILYGRKGSLAEYARGTGRSENSLHHKASRLRKKLRLCIEKKLSNNQQ